MNRLRYPLVTLCTLGVLLAGSAAAPAAVVKFLNTGYNDATGNQLANGTNDTDYFIGPGGTGSLTGINPRATSSPIPLPWLSDAASSASRWLVLPGSGLEGISVGPGTYFFDTTADLTGFDPATAQINNLRYAADNKLVGVWINGTRVFFQNQQFAEEFASFRSLGNLGAGLFTSGLNQIRFEVSNQLSSPSPLGLRVEGSVDAQPLASAVPEPTTLVLVGALCAGGLGYVRWRRSRTTG